MSEENVSQDTGINVDVLDDGADTIDATEALETDATYEGTDTKAKKSNVAKLLAKKNAAEKRVKELEEQIA